MKILIITLFVFLTSCTTTTKILTKPEPEFNGINVVLKEQETLKIFMIHGIGKTDIDYADKFVEILEDNFNFESYKGEAQTVYDKLITTSAEVNGCSSCKFTATASITPYYLKNNNNKLNLYSFYWEKMNLGLQERLLKNIYEFDGGNLKDEMVIINRKIRDIFDTGLSDFVAYTNPQLKEEIRTATKNGICFMHNDTKTATNKDNSNINKSNEMSAKGNGTPINTSSVDDVNKWCDKPSKAPSKDNYAFISISLGSQILFDVLSTVYDDKASTKTIETNKKFNTRAKSILEAKTTDKFYMLANQIPLIDATNLNFIFHINKANKNKENKKLQIISFTAPNDFLSYPLTNLNTQTVEFINIQIGNSIKLLGLFTLPIDGGHGIEYLENPKLVDFIMNGNTKRQVNE